MTEKQRATCCASVPGVIRYKACAKPGKVQDASGRWFCGVHDPAKKAEKRAKTEARWEAERRARSAEWLVDRQRRAVVAAAVSATKQVGSWDAVADAVFALERMENDYRAAVDALTAFSKTHNAREA